MTQIVNKISRLFYDRGIVYFSLENETPGAQNSVRTETISEICLRFEDFTEIMEFLNQQKTLIIDFDFRWRQSLLDLNKPTQDTINFDKSNNNNEGIRPPIGHLIGPRK